MKHFLKQVEQKFKVSLKNTYHPLTDESEEDDSEETNRRHKKVKPNPRKNTEIQETEKTEVIKKTLYLQ